MKQENVKTIEMADFKCYTHTIEYANDDFIVINSMEESLHSNNETFRMDCFLIAVCLEGNLQLDLNYNTYQLEADNMLLVLPNTLVSHAMVSPRYKIRMIIFSTQFLQRIVKMDKNTWDIFMHIQHNPIRPVKEEGEKGIFLFYQKLLIAKLNDEPHSYHKEVIQYLSSAVFCEILGYLNKEIDTSGTDANEKKNTNHSDSVLYKFSTMLSKDNGMHRSVGYYADALCYSSKYFSKIIKQASGRTPLKLINKSAIEHIKYRLKHSDKSIKEIAEEFDFPNQSFFGKYVKTHTGMSPANYRNSEKE